MNWEISIQSKERISKFLLFLLRVVIGALFVYSGFSKLIRPIEYFEVAVAQYDVIPDFLTHYLCSMVPWIELIGGAYLFLGYQIPISGGVLVFLTGVFQVALAQALLRKLPMDECGCFGGNSIHLSLYQSFVMDTMIVIGLIYLSTSENSFLLSLDNAFLERKSEDAN